MLVTARRLATGLLCATGLTMAGVAPALAAEVNVYTSRETGAGQASVRRFHQGDRHQGQRRVPHQRPRRAREGRGPNSPADVILLVDAAKLAGAVELDITQPVASKDLEAAVPAHLRDPNGHWFATTLRSRVIYASKDRVQQNAMTYEELADPKWKGKICIRSGQHPYNVSLIAAVVARYGAEKAADWLKGVKANLAKKPSGGDRDVAKDILAGVCDIAVGNTYYVGLMRQRTQVRRPGATPSGPRSDFAGGGTHVNISGVVVAKHSAQQRQCGEADRVHDVRRRAALVADINYEYPVSPRRRDGDREALRRDRPDSLSLGDVARHRKTASKLVDKVGFDN